jgi:hypothetical protein
MIGFSKPPKLFQGFDVFSLGAAGGLAGDFGDLAPSQLAPDPQHHNLASFVP